MNKNSDVQSIFNLMDRFRGVINTPAIVKICINLLAFKDLSNKFEQQIKSTLPGNTSIEVAWNNRMEKELYIQPVAHELGYEIAPTLLWSYLVNLAQNESPLFEVSLVKKSIEELQMSSYSLGTNQIFGHLFEESLLIRDVPGLSNEEKAVLLKRLMTGLDRIADDKRLFEYLINSQSQSAKMGGEYLTSSSIERLLKAFLTSYKGDMSEIYDPTVGTASLLLAAPSERVGKYVGQEINPEVLNLAYMNLLMHDIDYRKIDLQLGNTLIDPKHLGQQYDVAIGEPPFGGMWSPEQLEGSDPRFAIYEKVAPKSKTDFAYIQHMLYQLKEDGVCFSIHNIGVLFRGASEADIRRQIVNHNMLDAVITLPNGLYAPYTSIPVCLLIFKKKRSHRNVLFIDASNDYITEQRANNQLSESHIHRIVETYNSYEDVERYARVVSLDEIEENEFNLNLARYVDNREPEETIDIMLLEAEIAAKKAMLENVEKELREKLLLL
ncbi:hypothetical protein C7Y47_13915 [Lysinibacillus sphaericus]|uniref:site-specific DNA-methyltransferase (adenine-specific) n=1 Tax=Lysinibacillus sphaericus TaxID=1421 RepID=A0A544UGA6_LYSSH|nr:N-6 DNA methylase [Lysinibacillus sp. SDF0037]TQR31712.1 hypothetical protein C7Y47_13915 [Lysinibacillus sp. SDF0037]